MTMGFKYQMLQCSYPHELLHVTLNHLYQLRAKVEDAEAVAALVDDVIRLANERYAPMSTYDFSGLKQTLCRFFAEKRVKVSLFLQDGIQKNDGTICLSYAGQLPPGFDLPGKITHYDVSGAAIGVDAFAFPRHETINDTPLGPPTAPQRQQLCKLGLNLYSKDQPAPPPTGATHAVAAASAAGGAAHGDAYGGGGAPRVDSATAAREILAGGSHARQDLNLLADLIGGGSSGGGDDFKLNLFPETGMPGGGGGGGSVGGTQMITIDVGRDARSRNRDLAGVMEDMQIGGGGGGGGGYADDEDDLLSMMDRA